MTWHIKFNIYWVTIMIFATGNIVVYTTITGTVKKLQIMRKCANGKSCYRKYWLRQGMTMPIIPTLPRKDAEPEKGRHYDPNFGYEPYWPGGDWVFRTSTLNPNSSSGVCNNDPICNPVYKRYGKICGKNNYSRTKTFDDYCQMKASDCHNRYKWHIIHRGKCRPTVKIHPGMTGEPVFFAPPLHVSDAAFILQDFFKRHSDPHLKWRKLPSTYGYITQQLRTEPL